MNVRHAFKPDRTITAGSVHARNMEQRLAAQKRRDDSPRCQLCQHPMQPTGACHTCPSCGTTTGCG